MVALYISDWMEFYLEQSHMKKKYTQMRRLTFLKNTNKYIGDLLSDEKKQSTESPQRNKMRQLVRLTCDFYFILH